MTVKLNNRYCDRVDLCVQCISMQSWNSKFAFNSSRKVCNLVCYRILKCLWLSVLFWIVEKWMQENVRVRFSVKVQWTQRASYTVRTKYVESKHHQMLTFLQAIQVRFTFSLSVSIRVCLIVVRFAISIGHLCRAYRDSIYWCLALTIHVYMYVWLTV